MSVEILTHLLNFSTVTVILVWYCSYCCKQGFINVFFLLYLDKNEEEKDVNEPLLQITVRTNTVFSLGKMKAG